VAFSRLAIDEKCVLEAISPYIKLHLTSKQYS